MNSKTATRPAKKRKAAAVLPADSYAEFLAGKETSVPAVGIPTEGLTFTPALKPFQRFIVELALQKGRYALFEDCGLGKTLQQLEWARHIVAYTGRPVLVLTPLAVAAQTIAEGAKFGIPVWRLQPEFSVAGALEAGIFVTNYEQVVNLDPQAFAGVVLDESSILKNFTGQTKRLLLNYFSQTPYRLCCTATPSPNDHMELGNHAEFLGVMPSNEMISRWFINDTMKMGTYRLKHHAKADFWQWVRSWAMCIGSPADLQRGFDATGYTLPGLELSEELVEVAADAVPGALFADEAVTATTFNKALLATMTERLARVAELVQAHSGEPFLIWVNLNKEGEMLRQLLPGAVEVTGSDTVEEKEARLLGFARGEFRILITKKKIAQFGLNFQHCRNQIFASLDFSFEGVYQAIRRSLRFGQTRTVRVWLLTTRTMGNVLRAIKDKQAAFAEMRAEMVAGIAEDGAGERRALAQDFTHRIERGENWEMHLGDCCEVARLLPDNSVDFGIHSPPFANLYIYSDSVRDMGNCRDDAEFFAQYRFLIREHYRMLRPGRLVAVHCKNLVDYATTAGRAGQRDFRGDIIRAYEAEGFKYHAEVTIEKDPVIEMQRTKANGLLYKTLRGNSSFTRTGCTGCPLTQKDVALLNIVKRRGWEYLAPLLRLKPLYRWMRKPSQRHRQPGGERRKDGSLSSNQQRMGPLTMAARLAALDTVLAIQAECNEAAERLGRARVDILNTEEEARIRELIAAGTYPNKWTGNEPTADVVLDKFYADGTKGGATMAVFDFMKGPSDG